MVMGPRMVAPVPITTWSSTVGWRLAPRPRCMSFHQAVQPQGVQVWVEQHLPHAGRGRVFLEDHRDVLAHPRDQVPHLATDHAPTPLPTMTPSLTLPR